MFAKIAHLRNPIEWPCLPDARSPGIPFALALGALAIGVSLAGAPIVGYAALAACLLVIFVIALLHDPFWGLVAYMITFYVRPGELVPALAPLHVERIVGLLALAALIWHRRSGRRWETLTHRVTAMMPGFLVIMALSVVTAYWKTLAVITTIEFAKILVAFILIIGLLDSEKRLRIFVWLYLVLIGWTAGTSLWGYFSGSNRGFAMGIDRARGLTLAWGHPNSLAMTLLAALPYLFLLIPAERRRASRFALISLFVLLFVTIVYTGSRAGMLGIVVTACFLWWRTGRRPLLLAGLIGVLICGAFLMPDQYQMRMLSILEYRHDPSSLGRIDSWVSGMRMFLDRPLLGVGPGNFGIAHGLAYSSAWRPSWLEAHSIYVQLPAELGLVGLIWFALMFYLVVQTNRATRRLLAAGGEAWCWMYRLTVALEISLVALFFTGIFGHNLYRPTYYFIAGMTVSLAAIAKRRDASGRETAARPAVRTRSGEWEVT